MMNDLQGCAGLLGMRTKITSGLLTVLLAAVVLLTSTACGREQAAPQMDWQPPGFEIQTADGNLFQYPQDLEGPTIVLFWATWCTYCNALMPHVQSIVDEYGDRIKVVALNFKEDEDPEAYLEVRGFDFLLIPNSEPVAESWGVKGTPGLFLAAPSGRIVFSRMAIPKDDYPVAPDEDFEGMKHFQKAARRAPFWAARLRRSIDLVMASSQDG